MQVSSPAFTEAEAIPTEHTADGDGASPELQIDDVPEGTRALALVVDDPDAPREEPFVHWLVWNIPPQADTIAEGYPPTGDGKAFAEARQGTNDFGEERYDGPAPPEGDGPHHYRFTVQALGVAPDIQEGAQRSELENAVEGNVLAEATLMGTYER